MQTIDAAPKELALAPVTPMSLIQQASAAGASIEQMAQLFELKLRVDADDARRAYNAAFSAFKAEAVRIVKNVTIMDGPLKGKKHADLFGVTNAVTPALSKHGLSHSWRLSKDEPGWMEVTCTIRHELGHSESVAMGSGPDIGPGRNAIQARGSAKSYLERYTLLAATGLASSETDTDGVPPAQGHAAPGMPEHESVAHLDNIDAAATLAELQQISNAAYKAAQGYKDQGTMAAIIRAKDRRKKELGAVTA